ncbi:MAG: amidohydrolase family protein [Phycisphaerales bacterium]
MSNTVLAIMICSVVLGCSSPQGTVLTDAAPDRVALAQSPPISHRVSDAHLHLVDFLQETEGIKATVKAMDVAGIDHAMICGMPLVKKWNAADPRRPLYYLEDDSRTYWYSATDVLVARAVNSLQEKDRRRFHPFICGFNGTDRNAVDHIRRMLEWYPDFWEGIGEVMARHDDLTALTYGESPRADHVALDAVYALAAEHDLPVSIHSNIGSVWLGEPIYLHEMENAVRDHPGTRFIWCHAGISRRIRIPTVVDELHRLLEQYDNLWIDLSWVVFEEAIAPEGVPKPAWIQLIEAHPDRFMIGSDTVGRFANLSEEIHKYDVLLDALAPATARKVARDNFLSVLPARVRATIAMAESE